MESRMNEFRSFVNIHPLLRDEVRNGNRSWQNVYEEWVLYGDKDDLWGKYKQKEVGKTKSKEEDKTLSMDKVKNAFNFVKKINTDSLNKTLNNVQKVIQIAQTVGGGKGVNVPAAASVFSDWWE